MSFQKLPPEWNDSGIEPPQSKKNTGFAPGERPPAQWINWLFNKLYQAVKELQEKAVEKVAEKQLSTEDYTTAEKTKLSGIATGANNYSHPANHSPSIILQDASNRFVTDAEKTNWNTAKQIADELSAPQYSTPQTATAPVISLPASAAEGILNLSLLGNTINQLANNGANYANWTIAGVGTTKGATGIHLVQDGSNDIAHLPVSLERNTEYTLVYTVTATNLDGTFKIPGTSDSVVSAGDVHIPKIMGINKFKFTTRNDIDTAGKKLYLSCDLNNTAGKYIDVTDIMIFKGDQTANPLVNQYIGYGVKNASSVRLTSAKNIFGGARAADKIVAAVNNATYAYKTVVDGRNCIALVGSSVVSGKVVYDKFTPNTRYTMQVYGRRSVAGVSGAYFRFEYTDGTASDITPTNSAWQKVVVTSLTGKSISKIILMWGTNDVCYYDYDTLQIEQSATATDVDLSYSESYYPELGGSLPSARNTIDKDANGQRWKTQRINSKVLQASDIVYHVSLTNVDRVQISKPTDYIGYNVGDTRIGSVVLDDKYYNGGNFVDDVSSIGKLFTNDSTTNIFYVVAKGTYADLNAAKAALTGKTLTYQLANEIKTKLDGIVELIAKPNGQIIVEPAVKDTKVYGTNIPIDNTALPIKTLERVSKITIGADNSRIETDIALSTCTIAGDGLSFTSTALTAKDMVEYVYLYDSALSTLPTLSYSYTVNRAAQIEDALELGSMNSQDIAELSDYAIAYLVNQEVRIALLEASQATQDSKIAALEAGKVIPSCKVKVNETSTPIPLPNSTEVFISFNSELLDTDNMYSSANKNRITIRTAGVYLIHANISISSITGAPGSRTFSILCYDSAGNYKPNESTTRVLTANTYQTTIHSFDINNVVNLGVGDYIQISVTQTSGSAMDISSTTVASIVKIA